MPIREAMAINLDLHFGEPSDWDMESTVYIPVSPENVMSHSRTGWSVFELEQLAFKMIPPEFAEIRAEAGKRLEALGERAILKAYGPVEGDYFIAISKK